MSRSLYTARTTSPSPSPSPSSPRHAPRSPSSPRTRNKEPHGRTRSPTRRPSPLGDGRPLVSPTAPRAPLRPTGGPCTPTTASQQRAVSPFDSPKDKDSLAPSSPSPRRPAPSDTSTDLAPPETTHDAARDSSASFSGIGGLLSGDGTYDSEDSDNEEVEVLSFSQPQPRPRDVRVKSMRAEAARAGNIRSVEGDIYASAEGDPTMSAVGQEARPASILRPAPREGGTGAGGAGRPPTVVHFPEPALASRVRDGPPGMTMGTPMSNNERPRPTLVIPSTQPIRPPGPPGGRPVHGQGGYSYPQRQGPPQPHPSSHASPYRPMLLPAPSTPISPFLASPPQPHLPVRSYANNQLAPPSSPFAKPPNRSSAVSSNESISGYDAMVEKKALFRGGEEELISPFSPRPRPREQNTGPNGRKVGQGQRRTEFWAALTLRSGGGAGAEMWKRMSVMMKLDEKGGDSEWLAKQQKSRAGIRKWILIALAVVIIAVVGAVVAVLLTKH